MIGLTKIYQMMICWLKNFLMMMQRSQMMNGVGIMDETHLKALNQTLVSFENIHHKYGKITSVEDISFQIQHGEIVQPAGA